MSRLISYPAWTDLHAWLLVGNDTASKKQWILSQAKLFYCPDNACDKCEICKSIDFDSHPDLMVLSQTSWNVQDMADIRTAISMAPFSTGRIIYLENSDSLLRASSRGLANRLLKVIEEPQTPTWFFFGVQSQSPVLSTIKNRCGAMHFVDTKLALKRSDLLELLQNPLNDPEEIAQELVDAFTEKEIDFTWFWQIVNPDQEMQELLRTLPDRLSRNSDLYLQLRVLVPKLQANLISR